MKDPDFFHVSVLLSSACSSQANSPNGWKVASAAPDIMCRHENIQQNIKDYFLLVFLFIRVKKFSLKVFQKAN